MFSALPKTTEAQVLGKQFAPVIAKRGDSLREIEESAYWLELLVESGVGSMVKLAFLRQEYEELTVFSSPS